MKTAWIVLLAGLLLVLAGCACSCATNCSCAPCDCCTACCGGGQP